jgi:UDP-N-acetylenolpyruvoylglucosamine reductase
LILSVKELKGEPQFSGHLVSVSAGYSLPRLCIDAARRGLSGIEGLGGIPGTVGGALWMNAGAFGHEIGTVTENVRVARDGRVAAVPGSSVQWDYRHTSRRRVAAGATLSLTPDDSEKSPGAHGRREATAPGIATTWRTRGLFLQEPAASPVGTAKSSTIRETKGARRAARLSCSCQLYH